MEDGDVIELSLPPDVSSGVKAESFPLAIVYEDEHLLVVDKPAGIVTHPVKSHQSGTLANGVAGYFAEKGICCASHPVNRLDKDIRGWSFSPKIHWRMDGCSDYFRRIQKTYLALVVVLWRQAVVSTGRSENSPKKGRGAILIWQPANRQ